MCPASQNLLAGVVRACEGGGAGLRSAVLPLKTYLHRSQGQHERARVASRKAIFSGRTRSSRGQFWLVDMSQQSLHYFTDMSLTNSDDK